MPGFPTNAAEFLQHYRHDAALRWNPADFAAQQAFVNARLPAGDWLDWSDEAVTLELAQAAITSAPFSVGSEAVAILLAGPVVELIASESLVTLASAHLEPGGRLIGIVPCLRDNSPESTVFNEEIAKGFRAYPMAEELEEVLRDGGFEIETGSGFAHIATFNHAVLKNQLGFPVFRRAFDELEKQGYDPAEAGWGELRFSATLR